MTYGLLEHLYYSFHTPSQGMQPSVQYTVIHGLIIMRRQLQYQLYSMVEIPAN